MDLPQAQTLAATLKAVPTAGNQQETWQVINCFYYFYFGTNNWGVAGPNNGSPLSENCYAPLRTKGWSGGGDVPWQVRKMTDTTNTASYWVGIPGADATWAVGTAEEDINPPLMADMATNDNGAGVYLNGMVNHGNWGVLPTVGNCPADQPPVGSSAVKPTIGNTFINVLHLDGSVVTKRPDPMPFASNPWGGGSVAWWR